MIALNRAAAALFVFNLLSTCLWGHHWASAVGLAASLVAMELTATRTPRPQRYGE